METKAKRQTSKPKSSSSSIPAAYVRHVLEFGTEPVSVFKFCNDLGISEEDFYNRFGSFAGVERSIWAEFVSKTVERLKADDTYAGFSAREKILAFYFTLFEELLRLRSFALLRLKTINRLEQTPGFLKDFRREFDRFVDGVLLTGKSTGEIANRPFIDRGYPALFWLQMKFLLEFWQSDTSAALEATDAAIEKSVNVAFDLIGAGAIDTVIDFAKFMYQSRMK